MSIERYEPSTISPDRQTAKDYVDARAIVASGGESEVHDLR